MAGCPSSTASSSSCLDAEAMPHVSAFLSCEDRGNAARVCRAWRDAMRREASWKKMDLRSYRNKDTDCIVEAIAGKSWLRGVEHLNLEFLHNLLDRHLVRLSEVLHALKNININGCQRVTDRGVEAIARSSARSLVSIELYWNLLLTDAAVKALSGQCPELRSVNLSGCKHITDASLFALAEGCRSVTDLNLTRCPKITDDGLKRIAQRCNRIVDLNLYAVSTFTDKSLASFGCLAHLRALDLCGAHLITDEGLACLANCHDLRCAHGQNLLGLAYLHSHGKNFHCLMCVHGIQLTLENFHSWWQGYST